jgi:hypothetical protein
MKKSSNAIGRREQEFQPYKAVLPYQIVTGQDLDQFRQKLLLEIEAIIKTHLHITPKKWLKSHEVRKLLKISPGILQHLKTTGTITYSKIGGIHYYDYENIQQLLKHPY